MKAKSSGVGKAREENQNSDLGFRYYARVQGRNITQEPVTHIVDGTEYSNNWISKVTGKPFRDSIWKITGDWYHEQGRYTLAEHWV